MRVWGWGQRRVVSSIGMYEGPEDVMRSPRDRRDSQESRGKRTGTDPWGSHLEGGMGGVRSRPTRPGSECSMPPGGPQAALASFSVFEPLSGISGCDSCFNLDLFSLEKLSGLDAIAVKSSEAKDTSSDFSATGICEFKICLKFHKLKLPKTTWIFFLVLNSWTTGTIVL